VGGEVEKKVMRNILNIVIVIIAAVAGVSAQARQDRVRYSEEKSPVLNVGLKVGMPANETEALSPGTSFSYAAEDFKPGVVRVGPRMTFLKEGLRTDEVVRLLGNPSATSERSEHEVVITTYEFQRGEGRILVAEFAGGVLVRSWIETRGQQEAQADR
jgi:hypothetical protein